MKAYRVLTLFLAIVLTLSACNLPTANATPTVNANAIFTAAAQTVEVKLTEGAKTTNSTATPLPPSNTPAPVAPVSSDTPQPVLPVVITATPVPVVIVPTAACDAAQFVADVSIPDGTGFSGGTTFTKTWRIKNVGTCTWNPSYSLSFDSGDQMGGPSNQAMLNYVAPGGAVDISVNLQAPGADGNYTGVWGLKNPSGVRFPVLGGIGGRSFTVVIKVGSGLSSATSVPGSGKFAVTNVSFSNTCTAGKFVIDISMTVNKAGTVTYTRKRSDGGFDSTGPHTITFSGAGTQSLPTIEWGTSGTIWVGVYIDSPNHQMFQGPWFTCP